MVLSSIFPYSTSELETLGLRKILGVAKFTRMGRRQRGKAGLVDRRKNHGLLFASESIGRGSFGLGTLAPVFIFPLSSSHIAGTSWERPPEGRRSRKDGAPSFRASSIKRVIIDLPPSFSSKRASTFFKHQESGFCQAFLLPKKLAFQLTDRFGLLGNPFPLFLFWGRAQLL